MCDEPSSLTARMGALLAAHGLTLALAESCTGGLIGHRITDIPGSSAYFRGGVVAYAYDVQERVLGVRHDTLCTFGAVSEPVALEMAHCVRRLLHSDVGLAVTGIAGPGGGIPGKPVGLTYVALVAPEREQCIRHVWPHDRAGNKAASADAAVALLLGYLEGK